MRNAQELRGNFCAYIFKNFGEVSIVIRGFEMISARGAI